MPAGEHDQKDRDREERPSGRDETEEERLDRNLGELLQELRVALPGVQVLFAFLLAVPFQKNFTEISDFDKTMYFVTLLLTALSAALLIAPSAYHRLTFRYQQKHRLVFVSNRLAIAGLGTLALAMTCAILFVTNVLWGTVATTVVTTVLVLTMFVVLWVALPMRRRLRYRDEGLPLLDPPQEG
jgi:magnesium-transporting ATPase (P-type)